MGTLPFTVFLFCSLKISRLASDSSSFILVASSRYSLSWRRRFSAASTSLKYSSAMFTAARTAPSTRDTWAPSRTSCTLASTWAATFLV